MTLDPSAPSEHPIGPWQTEVLRLSNGGELPVIRHAITWLMPPLALRYALASRRQVGPGTLQNELRALVAAYHWAEHPTEGLGCGLEDRLCSGQLFSRSELVRFNRFALYSDLASARDSNSDEAGETRATLALSVRGPVREEPEEVPVSTYHRRLDAFLHFAEWAVEPDNHGGLEVADDSARNDFMFRLRGWVHGWRAERPAPTSNRAEPLTPLEVRLIRRAIGADVAGRMPAVFAPETRLRNWAMFELAFNYGLRPAELLLVRVGHLPEPNDPSRMIRVPRQQDCADAPGLRGKTPRQFPVPAMDPKSYRVVHTYLTTPYPEGRAGAGMDDDRDRVFLRYEHGADRWVGLSSEPEVAGADAAEA